MSLVSRGFGTDGTTSTLMLAGWAQSMVVLPMYESLVTLGYGLDGSPATRIRMGFSAILGFPAAPGVGKQYTDCTTTTWTGYSLQENTSPPVVVGDIFYTDTFDQHGYAIAVAGDGTVIVDANGDPTRQTFFANIWDTDVGAFYGQFQVNINNHAPQLARQPADIALLTGFPMTPIDYVAAGNVFDQDNDVLTVTLTAGAFATGVSMTSAGVISGTPTSSITNSITLTYTDPASASLPVTLNFHTEVGVQVPNIVGASGAAAVTTLTAAGLLLRDIGDIADSSPAGTVLTQNPSPNTQVLVGSVVQVSQSLGPPVIPTGPYLTLWQALARLANAGFVPYPVIAYVYSSVVPVNQVVAQNPPAGAMITSSHGVQLTVSMGPPNPVVTSTIPNVVGDLFLDAQADLTESQCSLGTVTWQISDSVPIATVISQTPAPGGPVTEWTQVSLVVASGPTIVYPNTDAMSVPNVVTP